MPKLEQQKVIYLSAEDGVRDTLKPRLEELGADTKNILFFKEEDKPTSLSQRMIEIALDKIRSNKDKLIELEDFGKDFIHK